MKKLVLVFLLLSLFLLSGCTDYESKYEKLQEEYDELSAKYDSIFSWYHEDTETIGYELDRIIEEIHSTEDYIVILYDYFEEKSASFDEAYDAYESLADVLYPFY